MMIKKKYWSQPNRLLSEYSIRLTNAAHGQRSVSEPAKRRPSASASSSASEEASRASSSVAQRRSGDFSSAFKNRLSTFESADTDAVLFSFLLTLFLSLTFLLHSTLCCCFGVAEALSGSFSVAPTLSYSLNDWLLRLAFNLFFLSFCQ